MAEGDDQKGSEEANPSPDDAEEPITLDLGIDPAKNYEKNDNEEECCEAAAAMPLGNEAPRREENPFSFKHFLRGDTTYQSQGARPKVYCDGRQISSISDLELNNSTSQDQKSTRLVSELASGLPDFVQDHLLIEQTYLGNNTSTANGSTTAVASSSTPTTSSQPLHSHPPSLSSSSGLASALGGGGIGGGNLPDFTRDSGGGGGGGGSRGTLVAGELRDMGLVMDGGRSGGGGVRQVGVVRPQPEFPLDLPMMLPSSGAASTASDGIAADLTSSTGALKPHPTLLLPDFLTDASRLGSSSRLSPPPTTITTDPCLTTATTPPGLNCLTPSDTVGVHAQLLPSLVAGAAGAADADAYRRQVGEQTRRISALNGELAMSRRREQEMQVQRGKLEDNLEMSNIRAASAESTIIQLKQEIKTLSSQISVLIRENSSLRGGEGASCSGNTARSTPSVDPHMQHFAQELRGAANTAERNLRQLLSGVDNLRMMASYMENSFAGEERPFRSDQDEDNTGPAL